MGVFSKNQIEDAGSADFISNLDQNEIDSTPPGSRTDLKDLFVDGNI